MTIRLRLTRLKLVGALAVLALAGAATAIAAGGRESAAGTLVLVGRQIPSSIHYVDQAPKGESAGDTISFSQTLSAGGKRVGYAEVTGTLLDNERHDADNLTGTLVLQNGTIVLQGTSLGKAPTQHLAVVGGTGAYAGARGEAAITNGPSSSILRIALGS